MEFIAKVVDFLQPLCPFLALSLSLPACLVYLQFIVIVITLWGTCRTACCTSCLTTPHLHSHPHSICNAIHPLPLLRLLLPYLPLCIPSFFVIASRLATVCADLLNIIHIVDGQWFLLANKKLNVGLVCWLDLVTCSCSVSPSSASSSCFHSHSHSSCSSRLVSRLVVVFYYDNCLPTARVTVRPWSHLRHLTMQLAEGRETGEKGEGKWTLDCSFNWSHNKALTHQVRGIKNVDVWLDGLKW